MPDQRLYFSKTGTSRFISHLDLMRTFQRAFVRAGISIRHTEGFHPHPYVSIPLPLPLGFSSECEILEFGLVSGTTPETLPAQINAVLPPGIEVHRCYDATLPFRKLTFVRYQITIEYSNGVAKQAGQALSELVSRESCIITKKSKKSKRGQTQVDIIPLIKSVDKIIPQENILHFQVLLQAQNPGLNPNLLVNAFRTAYPDLSPIFVSFHRKEVLDDSQHPYA